MAASTLTGKSLSLHNALRVSSKACLKLFSFLNFNSQKCFKTQQAWKNKNGLLQCYSYTNNHVYYILICFTLYHILTNKFLPKKKQALHFYCVASSILCSTFKYEWLIVV